MQERRTVQKDAVYAALCRLANHPTADEVYDAVHQDYASISRATVYRVLNQLAEKGRVLKVSINNGADHFDHQTFPHYHIRCSRCGAVSDVTVSGMPDLLDCVTDSAGHIITGYSVQYDGVCPKCFEGEKENDG